MSSLSNEEDDKVEIQNVLEKINEVFSKLKIEVAGLKSVFESSNTALPLTIKLANEKLLSTAKDAGIDMKDLMDMLENSSDVESEEDESDEEKSDEEQELDTASISQAAEKLTDKLRNTTKS